jgi:hypothetical protein
MAKWMRRPLFDRWLLMARAEAARWIPPSDLMYSCSDSMKYPCGFEIAIPAVGFTTISMWFWNSQTHQNNTLVWSMLHSPSLASSFWSVCAWEASRSFYRQGTSTDLPVVSWMRPIG